VIVLERPKRNVIVFPLAFRAFQGMVTLGNLITQMANSKVLPTDPVEKALYRQFRKIKSSATLGQVSRILERDQFVVVVQLRRVGKCKVMVINLYLSRFIVV
jgi:hypothetical protein